MLPHHEKHACTRPKSDHQPQKDVEGKILAETEGRGRRSDREQTRSFFFEGREVKLTEEQQTVVYDIPDRPATLVLACAGSGKSSSLACRIKHLVDMGVPEEKIILTTFTRDSAADMEKKLVAVFGHKPKVSVGTIDSLALKYVNKYLPGTISESTTNVGEYAVKFLDFLKKNVAKQLFDTTSHLFVDEFQDINDLQFKIIKQFCKNGVKFTAVGDDAQNIYSFRGSNIKYILNFPTYFEDSVTYKLTTNFRSSRDIVSFANETIEKNEHQIPKVMVSHDPHSDGVKPKVHYFERTEAQYGYITEQIEEHLKEGTKLCEIAVLCPQNLFLYQLEEVLTKSSVPNVLLDGKSDVRTAIKPDHVCLSTIHKSKGLEWDVVFMIQMNDAVFPSHKDYQNIAESRRLFYVGATRPRKILHITYSPVMGCKFVCRFVNEISDSLYALVNFSPECIGLSSNSRVATRPTIKKIIEGLNGEDYGHLKNEGLFPLVEQETVQLYKPYAYDEVVVKHDLYGDLGGFVNLLLSRMIGELVPTSNGLFNESALLAIHALKLDYEENTTYQKYKNSFLYNLDGVLPHMKDMYANMRAILSAFLSKQFCTDIVPVDSEDISKVLSILSKLYKKSKQTGIPVRKIPLFTSKFLPQEFEKSLAGHYETFVDTTRSWDTCMDSIWEVSKCEQIVRERRRRLLYKDVALADLESSYRPMWNDMRKHMAAFFEDAHCHEYFHDDIGVSGMIDVRCGDTIYEVRCSSEEKIKAESILNMTVMKYLFQKNNGVVIDRIGFVNPLKGQITVMTLESPRTKELLDYILSK